MGTCSAAVGKGLAVVESGEGTLISFSTQPGNVALDGVGRNSPYATALVKHITAEGEDLPSILINVRNDVMQTTERRQVPWEHSAMTARFFFSEPKATENQQAELTVWEQVKDSTDPRIVAGYLHKYPQGSYAVVARTLVAALEKQREMEIAERQESARRQADLRKAQEEVRKAQEDAKQAVEKPVAALSLPGAESQPSRERSLGGPFDGSWEITRVGTSCNTPQHTFRVVVSGGKIGDRGSVSAAGGFRFAGKTFAGKPNNFSGTLTGNTGRGTFAVTGGNCQGTWTAKRLNTG